MTDSSSAAGLDQLRRVGLVPVVRALSADDALEACRALVRGGLRALEVTMTVPGAHEVIATLSAELGEHVMVGAGTVTSAAEVSDCLRAGARFIVTPVCLPELVAPAHEGKVVVALGALTPTEVWSASRAGADVVKVFPASAMGGPSYIQALKAPFPEVKLMPTGGVTLSTIEPFLAAGAFALGVGGALVDITLLRERGSEAIADQARAYVAKFNEARSRG